MKAPSAVLLALGICGCATVDVPTVTPSAEPPTIQYVDERFGQSFTFEYPADWQVVDDAQHFGLHGPTVYAAVGVGDFDSGCRQDANSTSCSQPQWLVPDDGMVLAYHMRPWLGMDPDPMPSLEPGDQVTEVDGRAAIFHQTALSMRWHLVGAPEYIEARWGQDAAASAPAVIEAVIGSWRWLGDPP